MSRYYRIVITNKDGNVLVPNLNGQPGFTPQAPTPTLSTYTSLNAGMNVYQQGSTNYAAQRIELDIAVTAMDAALPNSFVRVHGVGLAEIAQSANLNGMQVDVYGGMAAGLPLANPNQASKIAGGQIIQCFGNWVGVEQTLEFYIGAGGSSPDSSATTANPGTVLAPTSNNAPANLVFQWQAGQPLMTPLVNTLQTAYPTYRISGSVHDGLVWAGSAATGFFATLGQLAQYIKQKSLSIIAGYAPDKTPGSYPGVSMVLFDDTITITDGTTQTNPKQIQFIDLIGQPTWSQPYTVQCTCAMRGDIHVGNYVTLPVAPGITKEGSASQYFNPTPSNTYSDQKSGSIFTGTFQVVAVRHVGNSRDASAFSWVTTLDMILASTPTQVVQSIPTVWSSTVGPNKYGFSL